MFDSDRLDFTIKSRLRCVAEWELLFFPLQSEKKHQEELKLHRVRNEQKSTSGDEFDGMSLRQPNVSDQ